MPVSGLDTSTDLADPALYGGSGEPERIWAALRSQAPVWRNVRPDGSAFWAVLSHREALAVLGDPQTFRSEQGMRLDADPAAVRAAAGKMLIITDAPRHEQIRRIISGSFTARTVRRLERNMRATAADLVSAAVSRGGGDFVPEAARLPVSVIADLLGVPRADWDFLLERTMVAFGADPGTDRAAIAEAHTDLFLYFDELLAVRRREPADDVLSAMAHGEIDGRPMTDEEIILNCNGLISGGNETTRHATLGGLLAFIDNPPQWQLLREDPSLMPGAVAEILRYTSPAMHVLRTAAHDAELAGAHIAAGDKVALWLPAINRDESVFADPDRFDISRRPNRHLAFAHGPHFCLGAALATAELTAIFSELLEQVEQARLTGPPQRLASNLIRGFASLPVHLPPRSKP